MMEVLSAKTMTKLLSANRQVRSLRPVHVYVL